MLILCRQWTCSYHFGVLSFGGGAECIACSLFGTHLLHVRCFWLRWTEPHSILFICQPVRPSSKNRSHTKSPSHLILCTEVDIAYLTNLRCNQLKPCGCDNPLGHMSSSLWKVNSIDCFHTKETSLIFTSLSTHTNTHTHTHASLRRKAHDFVFLLTEVSTGCYTEVSTNVEWNTRIFCVMLVQELS
jgi:hypothetical protein